MFRRTFAALAVSLADAQKLLFDAQAPRTVASPGSLPSVLEALTEHYQSQGEPFTRVALDHVVQLDNTDADSALIGQATVTPTTTSTTTTVDLGTSSSSAPPTVHLVVQLMRAFPNSVEVRERCCRCIANLCHLDRDVAAGAPSSSSAGGESMAERLVREGAMEQVLGTVSLGSRLSPRGRCWAAMAALNLIVLSKSGVTRATAANAEDVLAGFLLALLEDATQQGTGKTQPAAAATNEDDGSLRGMPALLATALDAALGALTGVLSAEAPDNAKGISFNYECVSYSAVEAITRTLLFTSELLVRDGRNDGAYSASLPSRRYGSVHFVRTASPTQQAAIMALLPLQHKGWFALQQVCSRATNLPLVFDALYEGANTNQESAVMDDGCEALEMTEATNKRYVAALSSLIEAAMFLVTEVEGLDVVAELLQLQNDTRQNILAALEHLTSSRKDLDQRQRVADAAEASAASHQTTDNRAASSSSTAGDVESAFELYPTPAAMGVTDVLASGLVADMALATAVRVHADRDGHASTAATNQGLPSPYTTADFTLLSKSLLILGHLGAIGDAVASSANTVAALQALLSDATEVLQTLPFVYKDALAQLFRPSEDKSDDEDVKSDGALTDAHRLLFLQQAAVTGQTYAVLWSALRTAAGVETVKELHVMDTAASLQKLLTTTYDEAIQEAHRRYGGRAEGASQSTQWVSNTAEESVHRLVRLGNELLGNMARITEVPPAPDHK